MYCIQYDEICKKHNFELKHDALGERVTLEYPADSVPKDTIRLFQNHLPEGVSAMAEKYSSDRFAIFKYNAAAAAGNTIGLTETLEKNKKVSAALSDLADDLKQAELEAKTWVCTDPDTCQWRRQVGGTRYELYDIFEAPKRLPSLSRTDAIGTVQNVKTLAQIRLADTCESEIIIFVR